MAEVVLDTKNHPLKDFFSTPVVTILASIISTFAIAAVFLQLTGPVPISITQTTVQKEHAFEVSGEGTATTSPDQAEISFGITISKPTVKAAQDEANQTINNISDSLKKLGVKSEDIKTTNYSVYPNYDYNNGRQKITGYNVNANLLVKFHDFDILNQAIDGATSLGANQVGGINFTLSDAKQSEAQNQARVDAVKQAKQKAESLAAASGIKLGKLINVTENQNPSYPVPMYAKADMAMGAGESAPTRVEPGSQEVTISVTLSYETL